MQSEFLHLRFPARLTRPLALTHVNVIPMDSRRILADQTIVTLDGRIAAIGPANTVQPAESVVVDGRGRYVIPGLADMYTHYRDPHEAPLYLAHGITCTRTSGNLFQLALERSAARAEFPSPWMTTASPTIDGLGPTGRTDMPHGVPLTRPEDAEPLVQQYVRRGYHQIVPFSLLSPDNLAAIGRAAAAAGVGVVGNCPNAMSWEEAADAGMTGFQQLHLIAREHLLPEFRDQTYWDRFDPAPGTHLDFESIRRLAALLAQRQVWSIPTLVFHQRASRPVDESMADPSLRYVPRSTIDDWESTIVRWSHRGRVSVDEWRRLARERAQAFARTVSIFHEEGAPQLTGTDSLNPYNVQGDSLHQELENFVAAGMHPFEALRCATSEAARFLGESARWGTLEVGKRADLVVLSANPLEDIHAVRGVEGVCVNGYFLDRADLDSLLEQRAALVNNPPPMPSTDLPASNADGVVEQGSWLERIVDADFGRFTYRHSRRSDGGWLLEECHAGADPRRHLDRRTVRLVLGADLTVRSGELQIESFVGQESGQITFSEGPGYTATYTAVDGYVSERALGGAARVPSEQLALSAIPRVITERGAGTYPALDIESDHLGDAELTVSEDEKSVWRLHATRPGQQVDQTYRVAPDGLLASMEEMMPLLWSREVRPGV